MSGGNPRAPRVVRAVLASVSVATSALVGVVAWSGPASAAGGEHGVLRIHAAGSVYAGSQSVVNVITTPGGVASYPFEVKNTGTSVAQFNFSTSESGCQSGPAISTLAVTSGSLNVTTLSQGLNGYFTAPINPGATALYTLKVTMPKTAAAGTCDEASVSLYDTAGAYLDSETTLTEVKATTGNQPADEFLNGSGQSTVSGEDFGLASSPVLAVGATGTFTVKLVNNSAATSAIRWQLSEGDGCASFFTVKVTVAGLGGADVTALALAGTYSTPPLAPKASVTLTVTIKQFAYANTCNARAFDFWTAVTNHGGSGGVDGYLGVPLAP